MRWDVYAETLGEEWKDRHFAQEHIVQGGSMHFRQSSSNVKVHLGS